MLGLQLPCLLVVLPLQLARVLAGLFRCPRLQQIATDSHAHGEDDCNGVEGQLVGVVGSVLQLAVLMGIGLAMVMVRSCWPFQRWDR